MTDPNYTHISFLLDRSGSMQTIKKDTEAGFDAYIEQQRSQPGRCTVTLAQFDTEYETVCDVVDIGQVGALRLEPRGATALLDAVARLIHETGQRLASMPEEQRPGTVVVGIMTDGHENSSIEWTRPAIKELIERQEADYNWTFSYLGANQDAVEVGTSMGIAPERALTYGTGDGDAMAAFAAYGDSTALLRQAVAECLPPQETRAAAAFTEDQRKAATAGTSGQRQRRTGRRAG